MPLFRACGRRRWRLPFFSPGKGPRQPTPAHCVFAPGRGRNWAKLHVVKRATGPLCVPQSGLASDRSGGRPCGGSGGSEVGARQCRWRPWCGGDAGEQVWARVTYDQFSACAAVPGSVPSVLVTVLRGRRLPAADLCCCLRRACSSHPDSVISVQPPQGAGSHVASRKLRVQVIDRQEISRKFQNVVREWYGGEGAGPPRACMKGGERVGGCHWPGGGGRGRGGLGTVGPSLCVCVGGGTRGRGGGRPMQQGHAACIVCQDSDIG